MTRRNTPPPDPAALLHAIQLQAAELEMQNVELHAANEALRVTNHALVLAHDRFRTLYDRAPTPFVTLNERGLILELNAAAGSLLGATWQDLVGTPVALFAPERNREDFVAFVADVLAGHAHLAHEAVLQGTGRAPADVLIEAVLLREAPEDPPRVILSIVDVTALKHADSVRRRAQDEVLAIVSHDLGGPLNAIGLACDALAADLEPEDRTRCVHLIQRAVARAHRLISDLLGVARIESGQLSLRLALIDLAALIHQVGKDHELAVAAAATTLRISIPRPLPPIEGDRDRLHQVLSNLIGNALVHARGAPIELDAIARDGSVVISVSDGGPGIPPDELSHVFERYRQGTLHAHGAGLGLAIVKGFVEAHHGTCSVTSTLGHGTRFEVRLPVADQR